ncbi:MAG: hypothetical protein NXI00_24755, partial [Cytophagales bacterium]|nr:hypothetical protein [Cytophagales bacterium]
EVYIDNLLFYKEQIAATNDATLSDIQVDGASLPGFNPALFNYSYELAAGTTQIPTVTGITNNTNAVPNESQATALPGTASILVTAEDGVTENTYTVKFFVNTPPDVAPASKTIAENDVIAIFSDDYQTVPNQGFSNYGDAVIETVTLGGNDVLKYTPGGNTFQVIELGAANKLNLSAAGITNFSFDVWFSKDITSSSQFLVKIEQFGASRETGLVQLNSASVPAMAQGQWITYDVSLAEMAGNLTVPDAIQQIVVDIQNVGEAYIDNIYFYKEPANPSLPIAFESTALNYGLVGFGGPGDPPTEIPVSIEADPDDANNKVLQITKPAGSQVWA